jgi:hypothetical protein
MRSQYTPYIIFSAHKEGLEHSQNMQRNIYAKYDLTINDVYYRQVNGTYKGTEEVSYMLHYTPENLELVKKLCVEYEQECFLTITNEGRGYLHYLNDNFPSTPIGFIKVTDNKPKTGDYSYVLDSKQYFTFV